MVVINQLSVDAMMARKVRQSSSAAAVATTPAAAVAAPVFRLGAPFLFALILFLGCLPSLVLAGRPPLVDGPVIWYENDRQNIEEPREREPSLVWDNVDDTVILPRERLTHPVRLVRRIGSAFGGDHVRAAANVNALDEVPNSSWFTNRIGMFPISVEEITRGSGAGKGPDRSGKWTVVSAKTEGVTPGFNIKDAAGQIYLIKFDPVGYLGMTSGAGVISARIFHAIGFSVPDDAVVEFTRDDLVLGDGVKIKLPDGTKRRMTEEDLDEILDSVDRLPSGNWHAISSKFLSGKPVGPFDYHGRRGDDPNDRIPHEDRRELRGLRIFAAWLNHFDTKQHNSLDMFVTEDGQSYVKHHLLDFASTLGSGARGPTAKYGYEYTVDVPALFSNLFALGANESAWRKNTRPEGLNEVGYFTAENFDPTEFKPLQPNTAFANLTGRDGYWAAKIVSAFTEEQIRAICNEARYINPKAEEYICRVLVERRDMIARRFFDENAPLDFFIRDGKTVRFTDLGAERGVYPGSTPRYRLRCAAVDKDRSAARWSEWDDLAQPTISLQSGVASEASNNAEFDRRGFLAMEVQVDRGEGWSRSVTAYLGRESGTIVAVDR